MEEYGINQNRNPLNARCTVDKEWLKKRNMEFRTNKVNEEMMKNSEQRVDRKGIIIEYEQVIGGRGDKLVKITSITGLSYRQVPQKYVDQVGAVVVSLSPHDRDSKIMWRVVEHEDGARPKATALLVEGTIYTPVYLGKALGIVRNAGKMLAKINCARKSQRAYESELLAWAGKKRTVKV